MSKKTYATEAEAIAVAEYQDSEEAAYNRVELRKMELEVADLERRQAINEADGHATGHFQFVGIIREISVHSKMNEIDSFCRRNPGAPVEILMNSEGGSVLDGFAFIDFLRRISRDGHRVTIVGCGLCASMAGVVLQVADERVMTPLSWLGIHEISSGVQGTVTQQEDTMKFTKNLQTQVIDLLTAKSNLTPARLRTLWLRKDAYLSAPEALKLGFIDRIEEL